ncbi:Protoporphyrinogen IX oxidase [Enhygromyxa salina]|uniref:Protoporphyrinogen IX oxidase n=1 Tax=Enhygromyxa salina TaxID=215803 RepID=A0A0C1ZGE7_9BACT|nr:CopD family protein [Enhygromyxa salina]KIG16689.1 Protoporphyrinogen IX oxidase [Enhygromyxa salina]
MDYTLSKALHIVGFISWFAGLFYIVRLFVYHAEATERPEHEREILLPQLELMARRLWQIITVPAMILTIAAGVSMVVQLAQLGPLPGWLHLKFALLAGLIGYTLWCGQIRRSQAAKRSGWTSNRLRMFNELGTMFMVAIVFLAVFRSALSVAWGVGGLLILGVSLMLGVRLYRKIRERSA